VMMDAPSEVPDRLVRDLGLKIAPA